MKSIICGLFALFLSGCVTTSPQELAMQDAIRACQGVTEPFEDCRARMYSNLLPAYLEADTAQRARKRAALMNIGNSLKTPPLQPYHIPQPVRTNCTAYGNTMNCTSQ